MIPLWFWALVGAVAAVVVMEVRRHRRRRENFPPLIPVIGLALTAAGVGANITGADKMVADKIWGKKGGAPTYSGRVWDGAEWSCPASTVETGNPDDSKACMKGPFHPPVWKAGGDGKWAHLCPNGTTPTPEQQWEKKCEVGWTSRVWVGDKWQCPGGTEDSGRSWGTSSWHDAHKQCKRSGAYTLRIPGPNGTWVCPPGTKDTTRSWGQLNGANQCKWTGP